MPLRHDLPKIKPTEQPTIFNHEAGKWGYLTGLVGSAVAVPYIFMKTFKDMISAGGKEQAKIERNLIDHAGKVGMVITGLSIAGALVGGMQEKAKQEREQVEGRTVKTPGYWNKGILSGMFVSRLLAAPLSMTGNLGATTSLVITLGGAAIGSAMRNSELERDYNQALRLRHQQQLAAQTQQQVLIQHLLAHQVGQAPAPVQHPVLKEEAPALENKDEVANPMAQAAPSIDGATASKEGTVSLSAAKEASV